MTDFVAAFIASFITIFVIMDPFASIPAFIAMTHRLDAAQARAAANKAIIIAAVLAVVFLFAGSALLDWLGITMNDFRIAGGIVLGLWGLEMVLGFSLGKESETEEGESVAVLIATPLLTGPGLLSSLVILSGEYGYMPPLAATLTACTLSWVLLVNARRLRDLVGDNVIDIFSKVMGHILIALAVSYVKGGLIG